MRRLEDVLHDLAEQDERLPTSELITRIERGLSSEGVLTVATMDGRSAMDAQEDTRQDRRRIPMMLVAGAALLVLIVVGLPILFFGGGDSEVVGQPTTTLALGDSWDNIIEVTFDGNECSVSGPTAVPARAGQALVMTNNSDIVAKAYIASIRSGSTFDDLVRMQEADDGSPEANPRNWFYEERPSFAPEHRPQVDLADNQRLDAWLLTYGQDVIFVANNDRDWFCAPLEVTAIEF